MTVYLLCFRNPDGSKATYSHASHYIGMTTRSVHERMLEHERKAYQHGPSALMYAVRSAGLCWRVARTWDGGRELEKYLKSWCGGGQFCPLCSPNAYHYAQAGSHVTRLTRLYGLSSALNPGLMLPSFDTAILTVGD